MGRTKQAGAEGVHLIQGCIICEKGSWPYLIKGFISGGRGLKSVGAVLLPILASRSRQGCHPVVHPLRAAEVQHCDCAHLLAAAKHLPCTSLSALNAMLSKSSQGAP